MISSPLIARSCAAVALFDLDGTLVDSASDITNALNLVRSRVGLNELSVREVQPLIGLPAELLFQDVMLESDTAELVRKFRNELARSSGEYTTAFPGVTGLLESLKVSGWRLGVATNKPAVLAEIVLKRCNLSDYFEVVVGSEILKPKPSPDILRESMLRLGNGSEGVMIGDTVMDVQAGLAANLTTIGVSADSSVQQDLLDAGAELVVNSMLELLNMRNSGFER